MFSSSAKRRRWKTRKRRKKNENGKQLDHDMSMSLFPRPRRRTSGDTVSLSRARGALPLHRPDNFLGYSLPAHPSPADLTPRAQTLPPISTSFVAHQPKLNEIRHRAMRGQFSRLPLDKPEIRRRESLDLSQVYDPAFLRYLRSARNFLLALTDTLMEFEKEGHGSVTFFSPLLLIRQLCCSASPYAKLSRSSNSLLIE